MWVSLRYRHDGKRLTTTIAASTYMTTAADLFPRNHVPPFLIPAQNTQLAVVAVVAVVEVVEVVASIDGGPILPTSNSFFETKTCCYSKLSLQS